MYVHDNLLMKENCAIVFKTELLSRGFIAVK
jgi:hypothetical protein